MLTYETKTNIYIRVCKRSTLILHIFFTFRDLVYICIHGTARASAVLRNEYIVRSTHILYIIISIMFNKCDCLYYFFFVCLCKIQRNNKLLNLTLFFLVVVHLYLRFLFYNRWRVNIYRVFFL